MFTIASAVRLCPMEFIFDRPMLLSHYCHLLSRINRFGEYVKRDFVKLFFISFAPSTDFSNSFNMMPPFWRIYLIFKEFDSTINFSAMTIIIIFTGRKWQRKGSLERYIFPSLRALRFAWAKK